MKCRILIISMFIVLVLLFGCTNKTEDTVDKAVQENNPALCKELEDPDEVKECFGLVAEKMNDPKVCLQATDRNNCITSFAKGKESIKYCDMTTDAVAKYACIASVTGDQTGRALESILSDWRSSGTIKKCKEYCASEYVFCRDTSYNDMKTAQENCKNSYPSATSDYNYCLDSAESARATEFLKCYNEELDCNNRCESIGK